jgi:opacity protein-like surface antigen
MMRRHWLTVARVSSLVLMLAAVSTTASAQIVQVTRADARHSVGFNLGYFMVKSEDGRPDRCFTGDDDCDTLVANLRATDPLFFEIKDFNSVTFGGEWLYAVSDYIESGVSVGFYRRTVPSIYDELVKPSGAEIQQDLKLRMIPITATVRFLPAGRGGPVEPYVGGGVGFINWRYSESGEFVDSSDGTTFVGPVLLGGVRFPAGELMTVGAELRWQKAEGDTNSVESQLLGNKIDLGGTSINFTFHIRF